MGLPNHIHKTLANCAGSRIRGVEFDVQTSVL